MARALHADGPQGNGHGTELMGIGAEVAAPRMVKSAEEIALLVEAYSLTGHGIGCQNWEPRLLSVTDETELEAGMVITLEPGLYVQGLGGVRLENTFLITQTGAESLTVGPVNLWEL